MTDRKTLKVAAAQIACDCGDIDENLKRHLSVIGEARRRSVDLLLFPELSLTGYVGGADLRAVARVRTAPELACLAEAAGPMTLVAGFVEDGPDAALYNAQATLREGRIIDVHRKVNLPGYGRLEESRHFAAGSQVRPFPIGGPWLAATLICADTWNPALPWLAALAGASLLLVPAASALEAVGDGFDNVSGWDLNLRFHALTYGLPVVMANQAGSQRGFTFWGGSRILGPDGSELARAGSGPELIAAPIDFAAVLRARQRLPTIRDAAPRLVRDELDRHLAAQAA